MEWRDLWRLVAPRRSIDGDVSEEIGFHIEERVRELIDRGWSEARARDHVAARFGDRAAIEETCRNLDTQRVSRQTRRMTMEGWWRDIRRTLRGIRQRPAFTAIVVTTLALGVGASTAVFSVVEGVLLRPLPYPEFDRLVVVWENDRATGTTRENASTADYFDFVDRARGFEGLAMYGGGTAVLVRDGADPLRVNRVATTRNLADVLGVPMQLGREFTAEEDLPGGPSVALLTDRFWRTAFGGDPSVVGRNLVLDDQPYEVVGVLPAGIAFPSATTDLWVPIQQTPATANRPRHGVQVLGRLRDEVTVASAQAEMSGIMADLEAEYPNINVNRGAFVEPLAEIGRGDLKRTLWVLFGAVLSVLAIACVNVANLLLARGAGRSRQLAVESAMGAGAGRIARRFLIEGLVVSVLAGALGVSVAVIGVKGLASLAPAELLGLGAPGLNGMVLGFALLLTLVISVGFTALPTAQLRRLDLQRHLKEGRIGDAGAVKLGLRKVLVASQLALAVVLLLGATLMIGTLRNLQSVDPGFRAEQVLRAHFTVPASRYPTDFSAYPDWPVIHELLGSITRNVEALPGVRSAAVVLNHPLDPGFTNSFQIEGQPFDPTHGEMTTRLVMPGYFETAGLTLRSGRFLDGTDRVGAPYAIVLNRAAADRYFPQGDAIGQRIAFWGQIYREVVGIVENERIHGLTTEPPPAMYVSMLQAPPRGGQITLMVRAEVPPLTLAEGIRRTVRDIDPGVPIYNVTTMEATLAEAMARERFASTVLAIFAAVALFLGVLGVHGVLAYLVAQRGHEVGVRIALGATRRDVVGMVVRQGLTIAVPGVLVGLVAAYAVSTLMTGLLFGVTATAGWAYGLVALTLVVIATAATAVPARRAASIDPVVSMRAG